MINKWLIWGLVTFLISGFCWFVSIIVNVITLGHFREISNMLAVIVALSLPLSVMLAIFDRRKK